MGEDVERELEVELAAIGGGDAQPRLRQDGDADDGRGADGERHVERALADLVAAGDADVEGDAVAGGVGEHGGAGADGERAAEAQRHHRLHDDVLQVVVEEREVRLGGGHELDARDELIGQVEREADGGGDGAEARGQGQADRGAARAR